MATQINRSELEESREAFLSRMSHEMRTPLNAVIGFSRLLESNRAGNQRPEDIELLRRVRTSGEKLLRMVEDVLDQSALRQGQLTLSLSPTNVADIAARVAVNHRNAAAAKGLKIRSSCPEDAAPVPLDAVRFAQVVEHLVDNAVKFTGVGTIRVSLAIDPDTRRPRRLTVCDTGMGIPADRLERIFQPFEQADSSLRRAHDGAGLGLPMARALCEAMGCQLGVSSTVGEGSRFTIHFPHG